MFGEDEIIYEIFLKDLPFKERVIVRPGDDGAVLDLRGRMVVTTDMLVEGVHFDLSYFSPQNVGFKAISVNVSDLAAMGARPHSCFIAVGIPPERGVDFVRGLASGIRRGLETFDVVLAGGDTVRAKKLVLSVTAVGVLEGEPLLRSGAKPGDSVYLSGVTGLSHMGMKLLSGGVRENFGNLSSRATAWHLEPVAETELGIFLGKKGIASSCIDVSDGLVRDLKRVMDSSGVGAVLWEDALGLDDDYRELAVALHLDPVEVALHGGEDFRLLFTVPPDREAELSVFKENGKIMKIGQIRSERGVFLLSGGELLDVSELGPSSFEHFSHGGA